MVVYTLVKKAHWCVGVVLLSDTPFIYSRILLSRRLSMDWAHVLLTDFTVVAVFVLWSMPWLCPEAPVALSS